MTFLYVYMIFQYFHIIFQYVHMMFLLFHIFSYMINLQHSSQTDEHLIINPYEFPYYVLLMLLFVYQMFLAKYHALQKSLKIVKIV